MKLDPIAEIFDEPFESPRHRALRGDLWFAGELINVYYWLGRLLQHNFFRESESAVIEALQKHFRSRGCEKGARLIPDSQSWYALNILLQHEFELKEGSKPTRNPRLAAALDAVMRDPELSNTQLATIANTTPKQIARMTDVFVIQKLWRLQSSK